MSFTISTASPSDAPAIARIFLSNEADEFLRLQLGTVDPGIMSQGLTERLEESIRSSGLVYVVARPEGDGVGEVVSYASWTLPRGEGEEFVRRTSEEKAAATEAYRAKILPGMNTPLVMDFREKIHDMQWRALGERRCYMLGNIGTLPSHRRQGAASALIRRQFEEADEEGVLLYLDTDEQGDAKRMYDRLGFKKVDEAVFDLSKYGGSGVHTHIGMVREPQKQTS